MIYRINKVLSDKDFCNLTEEFDFHYNHWGFSKNDGRNGHPNMGMLLKPRCPIDTLGDNLALIKFGSLLKYKCEKILKRRLSFYRVNTNIQYFGQESFFHTDGDNKSWTLNIFVNPSWKTKWGGEFIIYDGEKYHYEPYIPNDAVLFSGHLDHMGYAPNVLCKIPRMTVAYTYNELTTVPPIL